MMAFLAITGHYITADWKLKTVLISFREIMGRHSAENLAEEIFLSLKEFDLVQSQKVCSIHFFCLLPYLW
jgi:hypothetical protein